MAEDADLWRAARLLVDRYGDRAGAEAIALADRMREIGDEEGIVVWRRIRQYVYELQRTRPKGAVYQSRASSIASHQNLSFPAGRISMERLACIPRENSLIRPHTGSKA